MRAARSSARGLGALAALAGALLGACRAESSSPSPAPSATSSVMTMPPPSSSYPIVQAGEPVLRARAAEVAPDQIATPAIQELIGRMVQAMRQAPGVGLAAPQLGVGLRILVLEDRPELMAKLTAAELAERGRVVLPLRVFINPELRAIGDEQATFFEGCLSVKGYTALVSRSAEVEVRGLDEKGQPQTMRVRGWPARILQHEVDHLDGALYIDRMLSRSFMTQEHARARFAGATIADVRRQLGL